MSVKKVMLELTRAEFDRSRSRVYYGNMGEIIAKETLRRQGFEVLLTGLVGKEEDFLYILHLPKMNEKLEELRRYYNDLPSFRKEEETWQEFLERYEERIKGKIEIAKANRAFFGEQLDAFETYLKKLRLGVAYPFMYMPDLIAKKDGKIYVIEVKSSKGALKFLKKEKLRGLLLARNYGFISTVVSFNLKIEAKDFKMEEIS